jgi:hypothetical protein
MACVKVFWTRSTGVKASVVARGRLDATIDKLSESLIKPDQIVFCHLVSFQEAGYLCANDAVDVIFILNDASYVFATEFVNQEIQELLSSFDVALVFLHDAASYGRSHERI